MLAAKLEDAGGVRRLIPPSFYKRSSASIFALVDQGIVSLGNFATNLAIARTSNPTIYGKFVLVWALLLFANNLHASLVIYPFTVSRAHEGQQSSSRFVTSALLLTAGFLLVELLFLGLALQLFHLTALLPAVFACLSAWQFQEVCRRSLMSALAFGKAVFGDLIGYPGQTLAIMLLAWTSHLTLTNVFWAMALTSVLGGVLQFIQQYLGWQNTGIQECVRVFWRLGRWGFANNWMGLVAGPALVWSLSVSHGAAAAGYLQALVSVLGVTHPVLFGIGNAIVPSVATAKANRGLAAAWKAALSLGFHGSFLVVPYLIALLCAPLFFLTLFYGSKSPYLALWMLVRAMCINYSFMFVSQILDGLANGLQRPRINFFGQAFATGFAATLALPGAFFYGVSGAVIGICVSNFARLLVQYTLLRRITVEQS